MKRFTTKEFIDKSNIRHNNQYDYNSVVYVDRKSKVEITCKIHGNFQQWPGDHLSGAGCRKCNPTRISRTTEQFIEEAKRVHKNFYIYLTTVCKTGQTKVEIICPVHGPFSQRQNGHLRGQGCGKCGRAKASSSQLGTTKSFIDDSNKVHKFKYDYSKSIYTGSKKKVEIICPKHGGFKQIAYCHLKGVGCPMCFRSKGEEKIANFLTGLNIDFTEQFKIQVAKKKYRFDFYLPKYNLCIEYNGIQHYKACSRFGGEEGFINIKKSDSFKKDYCKDHNINFFEISYKDFKNVEKILKNYLL